MPKIIKPVAKGDFTAATISVDSQGRVVTAASGSAGSAGMTPTLIATGPASGTFTAAGNSNKLVIYASSGAGGGGGKAPTRIAGKGGSGVFAVYVHPISAPFSQPYAVGARGNRGANHPGAGANPGPAGGTTSLANVFNLTGGNGGNASTNNAYGTDGTVGAVSNSPAPATFSSATNTIADNTRYVVPVISGVGLSDISNGPVPGFHQLSYPDGVRGDLVIYENGE
jgi:hypothetical protein